MGSSFVESRILVLPRAPYEKTHVAFSSFSIGGLGLGKVPVDNFVNPVLRDWVAYEKANYVISETLCTERLSLRTLRKVSHTE